MFTAAGSTDAASVRATDVKVLTCVGVALGAMSLASIDCRERIPSKVILKLRHRFQMEWIDTAANPTQMVDVEPLGNRTYQQFVGVTMCSNGSIVDLETSIPAAYECADPQPASRLTITVNELPEAVRRRASVLFNSSPAGISKSPPACIMGGTHAPR